MTEIPLSGSRFMEWLYSTVEGSPAAVRSVVKAMQSWVLLAPWNWDWDGDAALDMISGRGSAADWPEVTDLLMSKFTSSVVIAEDRLSRSTDPDVISIDSLKVNVFEGIVSIDLDVSVFSVISSKSKVALESILRGMSYWQFPTLLFIDKVPSLSKLKEDMIQNSVGGVAAVAVSCCDGETVVVGYPQPVAVHPNE
ncbi:hypothetical protein [Amycolatopsis sp. DSM 110486]|uniref:hypothetical protein n=1 Tax=Amycolatopsis sp. DSM 110486 TaxID=2865832 RepID=UPI001C6A6724|nr:hypothetical protein [Amycolatopsis sp. DSM 110486]QYN18867.1 hypothetical protein K1T34_40155 [Amycolatopsis sp. DSM 110486]